jgi:CheY-like chemotaxis protein
MTAPTSPRPRALLLEDDPAVLRPLAYALQARGVEVLAAADGHGGTDLLLEEVLGLDVLVVDLALPGRDGWDLLRLVRGAGGERDLAVVVLAGEVSPALRRQLLELGADAVVGRELSAAAQAAAVAHVIATAAARAAARAEAVREPFLDRATRAFTQVLALPGAPATAYAGA